MERSTFMVDRRGLAFAWSSPVDHKGRPLQKVDRSNLV